MYTESMPQVYDSFEQTGKNPTSEAAPSWVNLPPPLGRALSSFLSQPSWVSFDTEEEGEKVVLLLRKHGVTNLPWMLLVVVMALAPLTFFIFPLLSAFPPKFQMVGVIFWYLLTAAFVFENFLSWFYNIFIVTDRRIIDVDFLGLMYRELSQCHIDQIENITFNQGGFVRTMFNFGSVLVQTAAEIENIEFEDVPDPDKVTKIIDSLIPESDNQERKGQ